MEEFRADGPRIVIVKQAEVNFDLASYLFSFGLLIGKEGTENRDDGIGTGPYRLETWPPYLTDSRSEGAEMPGAARRTRVRAGAGRVVQRVIAAAAGSRRRAAPRNR